MFNILWLIIMEMNMKKNIYIYIYTHTHIHISVHILGWPKSSLWIFQKMLQIFDQSNIRHIYMYMAAQW